MYLNVVRRLGCVVFGWDGYGNWQEVKVPHATADRVGQQLCYVRSVDLVQGKDF